MKNRLYSIAIYAVFLIPFVAPWEGERQTSGALATKGIQFTQAVSPAAGGAASFLPAIEWDMSDLDVRDAQNRPVRDAGSTQEITRLFLNSLFQLTVVSDFHVMVQVWTDAAFFSHLFHNLIFNILYPLWESLPKVWRPSTKRVVHNVYNMWITLSVGVFLCTMLFQKIFEKPSHQKLILRC